MLEISLISVVILNSFVLKNVMSSNSHILQFKFVCGSIYQHETYQCYLSRELLLLHWFCLVL